MKLTIGDYEIEVSARYMPLRDELNDRDTKTVLNRISLVCSLVADNPASNFADDAKRISESIYDALDKVGYYDEI